MGKKNFIAVYYFPNYHYDRRNAQTHGPGWNEWELVRQARPRFNGHLQPKVPLWGYEDESEPAVMRKKIEAAASHGIDAFIFDWYYYEDGLFLERALENGFMPAAMDGRIKFALMWANHDWRELHPWRSGTPKPILYPGEISDQAFELMTDLIIERYFRHPAYWKIDGKPYFSIYSAKYLGSPERLTRFREKAVRAGFPGLHINMILQENAVLPGETQPEGNGLQLDRYGFDSLTSYIWLHHCRLSDFPRTSYRKVMDDYFLRFCADIRRRSSSIPYYPNVTAGWDSSPRTAQDTVFDPACGYPYTPVMESTPREFSEAVSRARQLGMAIITVNAWNEWTEGSYLEPDTRNGFAYLDALKQGIEG